MFTLLFLAALPQSTPVTVSGGIGNLGFSRRFFIYGLTINKGMFGRARTEVYRGYFLGKYPTEAYWSSVRPQYPT